MFERMSSGFSLARSSWDVLRNDRKLLVFPFLSGLGCTLEEVDSDAIRTQGMYAEILAIAPGEGQTLVRVNLTVGGKSGTRVHLVREDILVAQAGDAMEELSRQGHGRYDATLQRDITLGTAVNFDHIFDGSDGFRYTIASGGELRSVGAVSCTG